MKRSLVAALIIGVLVSAGRDRACMHGRCSAARAGDCELSARQTPPKDGRRVQYLLVVVHGARRGLDDVDEPRGASGSAGRSAIIAVELLALAWVCLLYQTFFQPLPSLLALGSGFSRCRWLRRVHGPQPLPRSRDGSVRGAARHDHIDDIIAGDLAFKPEAKSYEVTAVVCDIANKHDLAEECSPAVLAEITEKFIRHATESFLKAGAYIEKVTGEGIVAVFGFPGARRAAGGEGNAACAALLESFEKLRGGKEPTGRQFGVHLGISSGPMIVAPVEEEDASICSPPASRSSWRVDSASRIASTARAFDRAANVRAGEQETSWRGRSISQRRRRARAARNLRAAHALASGSDAGADRPARFILERRGALSRKTLGRSLHAIPDRARARTVRTTRRCSSMSAGSSRSRCISSIRRGRISRRS